MSTSVRGRRTSSRRKGDANEQAILQTMERLLANAALGEISVEELARGAGISRPSFYFYFGSKEGVLLALLDRLTDELAVAVDAMTTGVADDPRGHIEEGIAATAGLWREHGPVLRAVVEASADDPHVREAWHATVQRFIDANAAMIERERARGALAADGPTATELATALVWLNERTMHVAAFEATPGLAGDRMVPVLTEVWMRTIYGSSS